MAILRNIKKDIEDSNTPEQSATAEFLQVMREQIQAARQDGKPIGAEDIVTAMMGIVRQTAALDEKRAELFKQLALGMLSQTAKSPESEAR